MQMVPDENYGGAVQGCVCCGGGFVQKVSAIWRAGTMDSTSQVFVESLGNGHGDLSHGVGFTQTQTRLAALFSPPDVGDGGLEAAERQRVRGATALSLCRSLSGDGAVYWSLLNFWINGRDYSRFASACYFLLAFSVFVPYTVFLSSGIRSGVSRNVSRCAIT